VTTHVCVDYMKIVLDRIESKSSVPFCNFCSRI